MMNEQEDSSGPRKTTPESADPVWSILPSYYMYSNTINMGINERRQDPPIYDVSSRPSITSTNTDGSVGQLFSSTEMLTDSSTIPTSSSNTFGRASSIYDQTSEEDQDAHIKENLLDNIYKLRNLSTSGNEHANAIEISIVFTKEAGVGNRPSTIIDSTHNEFHQGDYINGYVLFKNNGSVPIPFDMFYFVLEGEYKSESNPSTMTSSTSVKTFLQMFDFNASYNEASINRLVSFEESNCNKIRLDHTNYDYDPFDKTVMCLGHKHLVLPQIPYKRFFTFKIPTKLLDSTCHDSSLSTHISLPPSFGDTRATTKDFSIINSSIKYGVSARFIGRRSKYDPKISAENDEFVVLKDAVETFRVVPYSSTIDSYEQAKGEYDEFFRAFNERIAEGSSLMYPAMSSISSGQILQNPPTSEKSSLIHRTVEQDSLYEFFIPIYKTSAFSKLSVNNTLQVKTPKQVYTIAYIPPEKFRRCQPHDTSSWNLEIPIELSINTGGNNKLVEIKSVVSELAVLTIESPKYPLPIEMHHDILFNQFTTSQPKDLFFDEDTLQNNLISPSRKSYFKMLDLVDKARARGVDWKIEKNLAVGIKALGKINAKTINLQIRDTRLSTSGVVRNIKDIPWKHEVGRITKAFTLQLDLKTAVFKSTNKKDLTDSPAYDKFTLVPNFQSCHVCRMYYLTIIVGLSNGQLVHVKILVNVEKSATL